MTREEIKGVILSFDKPYNSIFGIINNNKNYVNLKNSIISETNYLDENSTISERIYHIVNDLHEIPKCENCKESHAKFRNFKAGYSKFCSIKCSAIKNREQTRQTNIETYRNRKEEIQEKIKKTNLERYGVEDPNRLDEVKNKIKSTNLERYGTEYTHQNPEILEKVKQSNREKYGVDWSFQSEEVKQKIKNSNLERYGVEYPNQNPEMFHRVKQSLIEKYGVDNPTYLVTNRQVEDRKEDFKSYLYKVINCMGFELLDEYRNNIEDYRWKCTKCENIFTENWRNMCRGYSCPYCFPRNVKSRQEQDLVDFIDSLGIEIIENTRKIISPYELDIYIPSKNIAIEYNGLYWHSEEAGTKPNYHLNKTNLCKDKGIQLIHIFEDEWFFKQDIVVNRLKNILGSLDYTNKIYARQCKIREIDPKSKNQFLDNFHLQGRDSSNIKLGAFYNNELVAVMTFSKGNISKGYKKTDSDDGIWELNRFCTDYNYRIPGIASKLLTYFENNYYWTNIFSYADKRWSVGNLYFKLGFTYENDTNINYWYIKNYKRIHRFNLRKRPDEPSNVSEYVLRLQEGYLRIWDCGNMKFSKQK